jgi:glycosyltransferase involved in cell wall biosynthesis
LNGKAELTVSVITAVRNGAQTIANCLRSVQGQTQRTEHIVIDGASTDGTLDIIRSFGPAVRCISEPDRGIYDALNKGIRMATGDIIGFLHADDVYAAGDVLERVAACMAQSGADSCYGDLVYVDKRDTARIVRYWHSGPYGPGLFEKGWMPPHPTFFVTKNIYGRHGAFNAAFTIAADYELMLRLLVKCGISTSYIPEVLVRMRLGGASNKSLGNMIIKTREDYRAWSLNGLRRRWYTIPLKNISKIPQFLRAENRHSGA